MSRQQSAQKANEEDYNISVLLQSLKDNKHLLTMMAKQLVETSLLLGLALKEEKARLREQMLKFITYEQKLNMYQEIKRNLKDAVS